MANVKRKGYVNKGNRRSRNRNNNKKAISDRSQECLGNEEQTIKGTNDLSWYVHDDQMLRDAASVQYFKPLGHRFNLGNQITHSGCSKVLARNQYLPGFMRIDVVSGPGIAKEATDPANMAARLLHTEINAKNSRNKSYDPDDLFKYIIAIDEAYAFITWVERAYGLITTYSKFNTYYPEAVIESMGFAYRSLANDLPKLRTMINKWILQLSAFTIPAKWNYVNRHHYLYKNVYADSNSAAAQTFAFNPAGFRIYTEGEIVDDKVVNTYLKFVPVGVHAESGFMDLNMLREYGDNMIDRLVTSQDALTMSADILKWSQTTGAKVYEGLAMMPEDYAVAPIFDPEVLMQIENTTINGWLESAVQDSSLNKKIFNITSDGTTGIIKYNPELDINTSEIPALFVGDRVINMRMSDPKPGDTMIATRLMNIPVHDSNRHKYSFNQAGSEIAIGCYITIFSYDEAAQRVDTVVTKSLNYASEVFSRYTINEMFGMINLIDKFAFHPPVHYILTKEWKMPSLTGNKPEDEDCKDIGIRLQELDTITTVNEDELSTMHKAAILGEFAF